MNELDGKTLDQKSFSFLDLIGQTPQTFPTKLSVSLASDGSVLLGIRIANISNTSGSDAQISVQVAGSSAGDPIFTWTIPGVITWAAGLDNSDSDKFKISKGGFLGTNDYLSLDNSGILAVTNKIYPGTDAAAAQTASGIYAGSGAPNNANGSNGDFYLRSDGTQAGNNVIYHREAGAWVALVTT